MFTFFSSVCGPMGFLGSETLTNIVNFDSNTHTNTRLTILKIVPPHKQIRKMQTS